MVSLKCPICGRKEFKIEKETREELEYTYGVCKRWFCKGRVLIGPVTHSNCGGKIKRKCERDPDCKGYPPHTNLLERLTCTKCKKQWKNYWVEFLR